MLNNKTIIIYAQFQDVGMSLIKQGTRKAISATVQPKQKCFCDCVIWHSGVIRHLAPSFNE